jgi:hypothetical protein
VAEWEEMYVVLPQEEEDIVSLGQEPLNYNAPFGGARQKVWVALRNANNILTISRRTSLIRLYWIFSTPSICLFRVIIQNALVFLYSLCRPWH